ncbi:MAG: hypothetical protein ACRCZ9_05570 [Fusobacteriaceae bacterium]
MVKKVKQMFCDHYLEHDKNFYGDEALHRDCRSYMYCKKCGKTFRSDALWTIFKVKNNIEDVEDNVCEKEVSKKELDRDDFLKKAKWVIGSMELEKYGEESPEMVKMLLRYCEERLNYFI